MPMHGEKWGPTGRSNERPPQFSWWAAGTLIGMVVQLVVMVLVQGF